MINRIRQQDQIIGSVNQYLPADRQLTGLTIAAINGWYQRNQDLNLQSVTSALLEASSQIGMLHDRSNPPPDDAQPLDLGELSKKVSEEMANKVVNWTL